MSSVGFRVESEGVWVSGFRFWVLGFGFVLGVMKAGHPPSLRFRVQGSELRVQDLGFRVQGLGFMVQDLAFRM